MNAIVEDLRLALKREHNMFPWNIEGSADGGWILMDYGDVVIHIFEPETREYYNLEEMWSEAPVVVHFQ
jgi:ribosome-associated protein